MDLCDIRNALAELAAGFDALMVHPHDAPGMLRCATAVKNMAAGIEGQLATRVAECGTWKGSGDKTAADHLARTTGTTPGKARDLIDTARRLEELGATDAAVRAGELSPEQASAIASAASVNRSAERSLLEAAKKLSLKELQAESARRRAEVEDGEARRQKIHAERFFRVWTDAEGGRNLRVRENPEVMAVLESAVAPIADELFRKARAEGRREPATAYACDGFFELMRQGTGADERRPARNAKVIFRVDLPWLFGTPAAGDVCEIVGYGPVAVSAVLEAIEAGGLVAAVLTRGEQVLGVAHLGRKPRAIQQTALEWLFPTCSVEGCPMAAAHTETDHVDDWALTHQTLLERLRPKCKHHHAMKTRHNWMLVEGPGKQPLVPPDDPRHPRYKRSAG